MKIKHNIQHLVQITYFDYEKHEFECGSLKSEMSDLWIFNKHEAINISKADRLIDELFQFSWVKHLKTMSLHKGLHKNLLICNSQQSCKAVSSSVEWVQSVEWV